MNRKLIIYGASGHGKVVADIAKRNGYQDIVFFDDDKEKHRLGIYDVVHSFDGLEDYDLFVAIGSNKTREMISKRTDKEQISLIHPNAVISEDVQIGKGVVVRAGAVINAGAVIEDGVIINTCASIDHDNVIGEFSHISVGAHTAGTVSIGKRVFVGAGSTIINNICVCDDVLIGAGAVVVKDILEPGTYIGVPAIERIK